MKTKTTVSPVQMTLKPGNSQDLIKSLGISKKRADELKQITKSSVDKAKGKVSNLLLEVSKECKNPNELALSAFITGQALIEARQQHSMEQAIGAVKMLLGSGKKKK